MATVEFITAQEIIQTAMAGKAVRRWDVDVVREGDTFTMTSGDSPSIAHSYDPLDPARESQEIRAAYSIVTLASGERIYEVMPRAELDKAQAQSKATGANSPWANWHSEMCKKCVQKRHAKRFSTSPELAALIQADHDAEGAREPIHHDQPPTDSNRGGYDRAADDRLITEPQRKRLFAIAKKAHGDQANHAVEAALSEHGLSSTADIKRSEYDAVVAEAESWVEPSPEGYVEAGGADTPTGDVSW
jgi:recombinational DNA repair protein RecT